MHSRLRGLLTDIRFWIVLLLLIRLVGITNAPLEGGHNWRQSLTAMISRNLAEPDAKLLYPKIDMAGNATGIIGSEFPLFNAVTALPIRAFGPAHWYGRLINLLVSTLGLWAFFMLIKPHFNQRVAFSATLILGLSLWFGYSRKIMPDTFSVSLVLLGLLFGMRYLNKGKLLNLSLFGILIGLGGLSKIPALTPLAILAVPILQPQISKQRKGGLALVTALAALVIALWYFYWVPHLVTTYRYQLYFPKGLWEGLLEIAPLWPNFLEKFYFSALNSFLAFAACVAGLVLLLRKGKRLHWAGLALLSVTFGLFILKTGAVFPLHSYYIIPFVPVMALLAGYAVAQLPSRYATIVLVLIATEAIANQQHDFFIRDKDHYKLSLESLADKHIPKEDLVVTNGGKSPQLMYFLHRKGWNIQTDEFIKAGFIDSLHTIGARYAVLNQPYSDSRPGQAPLSLQDFEEIYSDERIAIYRLEEQPH